MPLFRTRFTFQTVLARVVLMLVLGYAFPLYADEADQDRARSAMLSGDVAPLSDLLAIVDSAYPGDVLKIELEGAEDQKNNGPDRGGIFIYEIKILTPQGNLVKLKYDAKSLELLEVEGEETTD